MTLISHKNLFVTDYSNIYGYLGLSMHERGAWDINIVIVYWRRYFKGLGFISSFIFQFATAVSITKSVGHSQNCRSVTEVRF